MPEDIALAPLASVLKKHRGQEDGLITMLQEVQRAYGYLPEKVLARLSRETKTPLSRIYAVVTFYTQFHLAPRGRSTLRLCRGTACHVQGSESVITAVKDALGIGEGQTTDDLQFSLETVACLGTCFLAPVMMVDDSYHGKLDPQKARTVLKRYAHSGKKSQWRS